MNSLSADFFLQVTPFRTHLKPTPIFHHNFFLNCKNPSFSYSSSRNPYSLMVEFSSKTNSTHLSPNDSMDTHFTNKLKKLQKGGKFNECLGYLESIVGKGYKPDVVFCAQLIQDFFCCRKSDMAVEVVDILESYGEPNVIVYNILVRGFCKSKEIGSALQVLSRMRNQGVMPDVFTYNYVISSLCSLKMLDLAVKKLNEMRDANCLPSGFTYLILIGSKIVGGEIDEGVELIEKVFLSEELQPNIRTYSKIITAMCRDGKINRAFDLIRILHSKGYEPRVLAYNSFLEALLNQRKWNVAEKVIEEMLSTKCEPNVYTYSIMMRFHLRNGRIEEAMNLLKLVMERGLRPDGSFVPLVSEFCKDGTLDFAVASLDYMISCGSFSKITTYHPILASFCKNGSIDQARRIVKTLEEKGYSPNVSTYNIMIDNLRNQVDRSIVFEMVSEMLNKGIEPNYVTYNTIISCLCKDGMVDEAIAILRVIEMPSFFSYKIVILGLCKSHRIDDAIQMLEEMVEKGCSPSEGIYSLLIEGIINAGRGTDARELTEYLFQVNALSSNSITRLNKLFTVSRRYCISKAGC